MRRLGVLSAMLLLLDCRDPASLFGTAVVVTTDSSEVPSEQLRYQAEVDGGALLEPAIRPETPAGILAPSTSVRILLGDDVAGQQVDVTVTGLVDGGAVGRGKASVVVQGGVERPVTVRLSAANSSCRGCLSSAGACVDPPTTWRVWRGRLGLRRVRFADGRHLLIQRAVFVRLGAELQRSPGRRPV